MVITDLRFTQAKFEYFLLQIASDTNLDAIKAKLISFKQFDQNNSVIVLAVDAAIDITAINKIVTLVMTTAGELHVKLHAVLRNRVLVEDRICGLPVVDLPSMSTSEHIYNKSVICNEPVRSGMKIENDGDIIVTSFVSDNAELVATGNIHVYGEARGRLLAGIKGDKTACIFVAKFNAEFISIGGIYRLIDEKLPDNIMHNAVIVSLNNNGRLLISPMQH